MTASAIKPIEAIRMWAVWQSMGGCDPALYGAYQDEGVAEHYASEAAKQDPKSEFWITSVMLLPEIVTRPAS